MMALNVYDYETGMYLGLYMFYGQPLVNDCFLLRTTQELVCVKSRRWTQDGLLELLVVIS